MTKGQCENILRALMTLSMKLDAYAMRRGITLDAAWREEDHPRQPDGKFGRGSGEIARIGRKSVLLGFDEFKPTYYAQTATPKHDKHHEKHAKEMGITMKQWKQQAADLLNAEPCEDYLDWRNDKGEYCRYDRKTKRLVVGNSFGEIKTHFYLDKRDFPNYIPDKLLVKIAKRG